MKKRILFLASNPKLTDRLLLGKEASDIADELQRSKYRSRYELLKQFDATPDDLRKAMLDLEPSIVHFAGHGDEISGLLWMDEQGEAQIVSIDGLGKFFELFPHTECVFLNACYSLEQAEAIGRTVKYVVGMTNEVSDDAARKFAVSFYGALGAGKSVEFAYQYGSNFLAIVGLPDELTPVLFLKESGTAKTNKVTSTNPQDLISVAFEPISAMILPMLNFASENILSKLPTVFSWLAGRMFETFGIHLNSNVQRKLWLQWLVSSMIGFFVASMFASGSHNSLPGILTSLFMLSGVILIISSFQWQVIKTWLYPTTWWSWSSATAIGWTIGYVIGVLVGADVIGNMLYITGLDWGLYPSLILGLTATGLVVGYTQGIILNKSLLGISKHNWAMVNAISMFLGSLVGSLVLPLSVNFFALILGTIYGVITGSVLLPDLSIQQNSSLLNGNPLISKDEA